MDMTACYIFHIDKLIEPGETVGVMDLGGGSTQFTFIPEKKVKGHQHSSSYFLQRWINII